MDVCYGLHKATSISLRHSEVIEKAVSAYFRRRFTVSQKILCTV